MKAGFTLIESLLYISCSLCLALSLCTVYKNIFASLHNNTRLCDDYLDIVVMGERCAQDLMRWPVIAWKKNTDHEIIWSTTHGDYGWMLNGTKIVRSEGHFDTTLNRWHTRKHTTALDRVTTVKYSLNADKTLLTAVIARGPCSCERTFFVRRSCNY